MDIIDIKQRKKDMVIEFCKLGADFDTACTASDITPEEKELLTQDEDFVNHVNYSLAKREMDLLKKLNDCAEENIERGDSKAVERLLELLNPNHFSKVTKLSHQMDNSGGSSGKITVEFADSDKE